MILPQAIRPLPARASPLSGESLASLVRRTVEAMGYEGPRRIQSLLSDTETAPANVNLLPPSPALDQLAGMLGRPPADLEGMTLHRFAAQLRPARRGSSCTSVADSKTLLKYFVTSVSPICPVCLKEDPIPHERLVWSSEHCRFAWCIGVFSSTNALPVIVRFVSIARMCPAARVVICCVSPVESRSPLRGPISQGCWNSCSWTKPACYLKCRLPRHSGGRSALAAAAAKTPAWMEGLAKRMDIQVGYASELLSWLSAAEILAGWPDRFEEFLGVFQQVVKHRTTSTGISRRFGLLLRETAQSGADRLPRPCQRAAELPAAALRRRTLKRQGLSVPRARERSGTRRAALDQPDGSRPSLGNP